MTDAAVGGPTLPQERRLVTEIPGPGSLERLDRKKAHVADGVGTTLPVFVVAAGGGVIVDVDGNSLIDLGSGIAVTTVGNAAPGVVANVQRQVEASGGVAPRAGALKLLALLALLRHGERPLRPDVLFCAGVPHHVARQNVRRDEARP